MRWRSSYWLYLSVALLLAVAVFLLRSSRQSGQPPIASDSTATTAAATPASAVPSGGSGAPGANQSAAQPVSASTTPATTPPVTNRFPYRLTNTTKDLGVLSRSDRAILLANAFIDTAQTPNLAIPTHLRSTGDPGTYVVQSRGPTTDGFRKLITDAGGTIISYIPNNAYLVRVGAGGAQTLAGNGRVQMVLPYEPYYKFSEQLLEVAVQQKPLPANDGLKLSLFADARAATIDALQQLGARVVNEERSPFGPVLFVQVEPESLAGVAGLPGVQGVELVHRRARANDLARVYSGVSVNAATNANYLGLTGLNVLVNVNDSGVDATQPNLSGRVIAANPLALVDTEGHGTHVAGTVAGSGLTGLSGTNVASGSVTNANFRGMAPAARIFSQVLNFVPGAPALTDFQLQVNAARTNALISNNSWGYVDATSYDLASASFDAAVRDALPGVFGSQPLVYVFAAGNEGFGDDNGTGGSANTIRSPATAKNVITVGAYEQLRDITNEVFQPSSPRCATGFITNTPFLSLTDSSNQVASFSSRGNVGVGTEGIYGRFKPDVVAPGTFVASTLSGQFNNSAYYNPTNVQFNTHFNQRVRTNALNQYSVFVPCGAVELIIFVWPNVDSPASLELPIFVRLGGQPTNNIFDVVRTNQVNIPPDLPALTTDVTYNYAIGNPGGGPISYNVTTAIVTTNDFGNYFQVLSNLNSTLEPNYFYESGTSMATPVVSGMLALMQEFFQNLGVTNSPALMKALLINGARSLNSIYDMQVQTAINYQGWGRANLPTALPLALSNMVSQGSAPTPILVFDQNADEALATGQSRTYNINLPDPAAVQAPLRVTLVWTDPPGSPAAGIKLVNNLDLVVTNLDTGDIYLGNDIPQNSVFSQFWDTNFPPNSDMINNVENVYLSEAFGTNFSITVVGRGVNVNAVTANTNGITQDYALVISSGDATNLSAMTLAPVAPVVTTPTNNITVLNAASNGFPILNQFVGANFPLTVSTNGTTNQWHFYVVTNETGFTNFAVVTFLPPTLSIPRMGVNEDEIENATRFEADIDLYVSQDPLLLELDPAVLDNAARSRTRGGSESVVFTDSMIGDVYYIGVKSEDQEASEYGFLSVFSETPFAEETDTGVLIHGVTVPQLIPDGSPGRPAAALIFGINPFPMQVRRMIITNSVYHQDFGDLLVELNHGGVRAVLHNHTFGDGTTNQTFIYEDNGEGDIPGARPSDGPGSLQNFIGQEAVGVWLMAFVDSTTGSTGEVQRVTIDIEKQFDDEVTRTILAGGSFIDSVVVPPEATNLTVSVTGNTLPMLLALKRGEVPTPLDFDHVALLPAPGGQIVVTPQSFPPLQAGRYFILVFNPNNVPQTVTIRKQVFLDLSAVTPLLFTSEVPMPILDDAVTNFVLSVPETRRVARAEVGVRIDHPRVADLALTLISPRGTRILLSENRGGLSTEGFGSSVNITNATTADSGDFAASTNNFNTVTNEGTVQIDYNFFTIADVIQVEYEGSLVYPPTSLQGAGTFYVPFGPGTSSIVTIVVNPAGNADTNTLWDYSAVSGESFHNYAIFTENPLLTTNPIKFALPPFNAPNYTGTNSALTNGIFFLPEETLKTLEGELPRGNWQLEVLDNRVGATNPTPTLLSWQLQLVLDRPVIPATQLTHGQPVTNTVATNEFSFFFVDVPLWASFATNTLISSTEPVNVWFSQVGLPTGTNAGDFLMLGNVTSGAFTLETNGAPPLVPGQRYYLAVENLGANPAVISLMVEFDITTLQNAVPVNGVSENFLLPRYFQFDVTSNATAVIFSLTNLSGNVNLIAKKGLPLPTLTDHDYGSFNPGATDESIFVFPNSSPVPLSAGRWYLAVLSADSVPVNYTIVAVELTNALPTIIPLTNGIPYFSGNSGTGDTNDYYRFTVLPSSVRAQFEILKPSGDMTLVLRKGFPPLPDLTTYDYISTNAGASNEVIIVLTNSTPVPLSGGEWFVTAVNVSGAPVTYQIRATQFEAPTEASIIAFNVISNSLCLTWISTPGVQYIVQGTPTASPAAWTNVSPVVTATGPQTTYCVPLPTPYPFFRVIVEPAAAPIPPAAPQNFTVIWNPGGAVLSWIAPANQLFQVQWSPTIAPPSWSTFTNIIGSTTGFFTFTDDGSQTGGLFGPRYYRLRAYP